MISPNGTRRNIALNRLLHLVLVVLLCAALAAHSAYAQSTTTLLAGTQDFNQFGLADVTLPGPRIILPSIQPPACLFTICGMATKTMASAALT